MNGATLSAQPIWPLSFPNTSCFAPPYYENSLRNLATSRDIPNHLPSFVPLSDLSSSLSHNLYSKSTSNCDINGNTDNTTLTNFHSSNFLQNQSRTTFLSRSSCTTEHLPERNQSSQNYSSRRWDLDGLPMVTDIGHSKKKCPSGTSTELKGVSQVTNVNSTVFMKPRGIVRRKVKSKGHSTKIETVSRERSGCIWHPLFSPPRNNYGTAGKGIIDNCSQNSQISNTFDICNLLKKDNLSTPSFSGYNLRKISCDSSNIDRMTLPTSLYANDVRYVENKQSHPIPSSTMNWTYKYSDQNTTRKNYFQPNYRPVQTSHNSSQFIPGTGLNGSENFLERYSNIDMKSSSMGNEQFRVDQKNFKPRHKQVGNNNLPNFADGSDTPPSQTSQIYSSSPTYAESWVSQYKYNIMPSSYYQRKEVHHENKDCSSEAFPNGTSFCRGTNWLDETRASVLQEKNHDTRYTIPGSSNKYQRCNLKKPSHGYLPKHDRTYHPQREKNERDENEQLRQYGEGRIPEKSSKKSKRLITRIFHCGDCPKIFRCKSQLKRHERIHTGVRPFICEVCGDSFSQLANLTYHRRIHTNERPYICRLCGKTFRNSSHLNRHLRSHTGEKPYSCKDCLMRFSTWDNKSRHKLPGKCPSQK